MSSAGMQRWPKTKAVSNATLAETPSHDAIITGRTGEVADRIAQHDQGEKCWRTPTNADRKRAMSQARQRIVAEQGQQTGREGQ